MAAYTSTQTGDFSDAATWGGGGAPTSDGDTFNITSGHTVTIDANTAVPTNGFGDSYIYGILQSANAVSNTLRMDGRLYIKGGGLLHLRTGATVEITGTSPEQHGIWQENENGASVIMEGSDGMPCTTLSSGGNEGMTSLAVTNASSFAAGEWIAVFDNFTNTTESVANCQFRDEGFWIHEVDGNTIYFRTFVSPEETVESVRGSNIIVSNAKVYRKGQKIIFGTGANRNIKTIDSIDYNRNRLKLDSTVTGSVVGQTIYLTGTDKIHSTNEKVRKVATIATAESANTSNTITVADASSFQVGDDIFIERVSEADGSTDYAGWWSAGGFKDTKHTIDSISGNDITLTSAIDYTVKEKALVMRLSRDVVVKCTTPDVDHGFFYSEYYSSNFNKKLILKDVYFKDVGNDDSNSYSGCVVRGYYSTNSLPVTLNEQVPSYSYSPWMEGIVARAYPDGTHQRDWGVIWLYDTRGAQLRCSMTMHGDDGIALYYEPYQSCYNCLATGADSNGFRIEGLSGPNEMAYCYSTRNNLGYRLYQPYQGDSSIWHDLIGDALQYGTNIISADGCILESKYRMKFTGLRRMQYDEAILGASTLYSSYKSLSGYVNSDAGTGTTNVGGSYWYSGRYRYSDSKAITKSVEDNFEYDRLRIFGYHLEGYWDLQEDAWRIFVRYDSSAEPGLFERVFVPAGTTLRVRADVKMAPSFSGSYPRLAAWSATTGRYRNMFGNSGGDNSNFLTGLATYSGYTSSALTDYEEKTLTINAVDWNRTICTGVYSTSSNATEGFWIKNFEIYLDTPYVNPAFNMLNNVFGGQRGSVVAKIKNSFDQQKTRLGGRLK